MKISIRNKLLFSYIGLALAIVAGQFVFNAFFMNDLYVNLQEKEMKAAFSELATAYDGTVESLQTIANAYENRTNVSIVCFDDNGLLYVTQRMISERSTHLSGNMQDMMDNTQYTVEPTISVQQNAPDNQKSMNLGGLITFGAQQVYVAIMLPMQSLSYATVLFTNTSTYISFIVLIIGSFFAVLMANSITKPIGKIEKTTSKLSRLDFSTHLDESSRTTELAQLAHSINNMSAHLERAISDLGTANEALQQDVDKQRQLEQMRREFVANVSHEMKTPLTLLQIYSENLKNEVEGIDKDYYCDTILEETAYLHKMVESMLSISAIESGVSQMEFSQFSLSDLARDMLDKLSPLLCDVQLSVQIAPNIMVHGDPIYFDQAMKNYVNNALAHTRKGGNIRISLSKTDKIVFSVFNQGEGIPPADQVRIWESFYKSDRARVRSSSANAGLGLHIVRRIVTRHNGACAVQNIDDGVEFSITLPCLPTSNDAPKTIE